ncbi:MAG: GNAT family N-acetyltransferase [candidate division Zixibacteria bacterium]|nr:GNAT family N-acetyltransferase [candidate division Zixibacteria bacterium]
MIVYTLDKHRLQKHFRKDPILFAYHLGDLDDMHFDRCQWAAIYGDSRYIKDLILIYASDTATTVMAFGLTEEMTIALEEIRDLLPSRFYCHYNNAQYKDILSGLYTERPLGKHFKMTPAQFLPDTSSEYRDAIVRLTPANVDELVEFYQLAYPDGYFDPRMLETGKYFGYRESERIVAAAGVHVYSHEYNAAVIGSVAVDPGFRGHGLATAVTSALTQELVDEGKLVMLNVKADNQAAIRAYEKLGFVKSHEYYEGIFERKV